MTNTRRENVPPGADLEQFGRDKLVMHDEPANSGADKQVAETAGNVKSVVESYPKLEALIKRLQTEVDDIEEHGPVVLPTNMPLIIEIFNKMNDELAGIPMDKNQKIAQIGERFAASFREIRDLTRRVTQLKKRAGVTKNDLKPCVAACRDYMSEVLLVLREKSEASM